jgi:hypothetical protein
MKDYDVCHCFRQIKQRSCPKISWYVLEPVIIKEDVSMPLEIQVDVSVPREFQVGVSAPLV